MKKLFIVLPLFFFCCGLRAQISLNLRFTDSVHLVNGYVPVDFTHLFIKDRFCFGAPAIVDSDSTWELLKQKCRGGVSDSLNLDSFILLQSYFGGDCHVRFVHRVYLDTVAKKMIWKVYNIWGGCRAGGGRHFAIKVPRPPAGYTPVIDEVLVDRLYDGKEEDWGDY